MRVVLDTNTVISGLLWSGRPRHVLDAARKGKIEIFTAQALLDELEQVLRRDKFAARLALAGVSYRTLVEGYAALAGRVEPSSITPVVVDDPDDDIVLACAFEIRADAIVSGDSHLLKLRSYSGIPILRSSRFLELLESAQK